MALAGVRPQSPSDERGFLDRETSKKNCYMREICINGVVVRKRGRRKAENWTCEVASSAGLHCQCVSPARELLTSKFAHLVLLSKHNVTHHSSNFISACQ